VAGTDKTPLLHNIVEAIHEYILKIQIGKKLHVLANPKVTFTLRTNFG